ncbi:MAG: V-type ATP synthase subunit B, partial [Acholeplasmataceae bacterium]
MIKQFVGLDEISGPLIFLDNVKDVGYEEMVEIKIHGKPSRHGRVVQIDGERVAIQVFEGTHDISLRNTTSRFFGKPVEIG